MFVKYKEQEYHSLTGKLPKGRRKWKFRVESPQGNALRVLEYTEMDYERARSLARIDTHSLYIDRYHILFLTVLPG